MVPSFSSIRATALLVALVPGVLAAQGIAMDTASLSAGRYAEASTLLEKTIFRIDVARLRLRFGAETALGLESLLDGRPRSESLADTAVGLVDPAFARSLSDSLPAWYASLRVRGVRDGDVMMYRIIGDTLRTVFRTVDGQSLVDQVDIGPQPRLSVLGGFLAPGSDFRKGILNSLFGPLREGSAPPGLARLPGLTPGSGVTFALPPPPSR